MNLNRKKVFTHVGIILLMFAISCIYFMPVLNGKVVIQGDIQKAESMSHEQMQIKELTGSIPNWNSSMFSGMPGYQTAIEAQKSVFTPIKSISILRPLGLERNIGVLFLYLVGFYIALLALGCSPLIALIGALGFGLGSYNIIIIEAGHITKAWALSMMAPILAGMLLCWKGIQGKQGKHLLWGGILFTLALGLQITFNHIQITFYTALCGLVMGIVYFICSLKEKNLRKFLIGTGVLLIGCVFALACNARHLLVNQEYMKETMRGGSEISVKPDGAERNASTKGLDIDYAFNWSYGIGETYTILVPGSMGGGSGEKVSHESESYKNFHQDRMPLYWGNQPFTSGPVYFGAIIVLMFLFGLLVVKGPERWWILIATILSIMLSWGSNFMSFNEWIFNNIPLYNKFRTPSMALVLANVTMVLMGMLALDKVVKTVNTNGNDIELKSIRRKLFISTGITGGIILIGLILKGGLSFSGVSDTGMSNQYGNQWSYIQDIFIKDRKALFVSDSWRSIVFILLASGIIWMYLSKKPKKSWMVLCALLVLIVVDLWGVDRRYLNEDNFARERDIETKPDSWDYEIDAQAAQFGDQSYRVMNLTVNTFNDSKPSAFHHQVGGYSAAKLRRYQDLIDFYLNNEAIVNRVNENMVQLVANPQSNLTPWDNIPILDMLNCRYIVYPNQNTAQVVRRNTANGDVWFVKKVEMVEDANAEILAMKDFDPKQTAIIDKSQWGKALEGFAVQEDSLATIELVAEQPYNPDHLRYKSHSEKEQLAVFSEIFYAPDWRAYIDGKPAEYLRADYVLRALVIPAGEHDIEFRNEAPTLHKLDKVTMISSIIMVLCIGGVLFVYYRKRHKTNQ